MADLTDNLSDKQKEDLLKILRKEEMAASNFQDSELMGHRSDSLDYYDREPYGDEQEGSSRVVTSEFADTIESIMPSMMRVFAGSESSVEFSPTGPGQEQAVEEADEYVPHVLMVKNDGYRILYWFIKDALMYRLSGATVDVEEIEETKDFPINGLPQDAIDVLVKRADLVGAELVEDLTPDPPPPPAPLQIDPQSGQPVPQEEPPATFSGTITATQKRKLVIADNIASEDILFTPTARDQDKASYLGFRKKVSASELVELGMEWEDVELLKSDRPISPEETQRNAAGIVSEPVRNETSDSERTLWVIVAYARWAPKDDGKSKMYRVVYAHSRGDTTGLIEVKEWEGPASIALATPILMSHTIIGRSLFDQVKDLQEIGSVLTRGLLNNLYAVNTPRPIVDDQVNLDSLLDWTPGSPIRLKANAKAADSHVSFLQVPSVLQNAQSALEYFQTVRENRTGVIRNNQGLDADSLNKTASGMNMMMGAAQQRIELIARTLAETAIKRLYRLVYRAIKRAAKGPIQYWNGQSMGTVDPTKWPDDLELTVNVGAGTRDQALQGLAMIAAAQEKLIVLQQGQANGPYVTAENVANLVHKTSETIGYKTPGMFFQPPEKVVAQVQHMAENPPLPTPEQQAAMAKFQAESQRAQAESVKAQAEATKSQNDTQIAGAKAHADAMKAQADHQKAFADAVAAENKGKADQAKQAHDAMMKQQELELKARELELKNKQIETDSYHKEQDRQLQLHTLAANQKHEKHLAKAKDEGDGPDPIETLGSTFNQHSEAAGKHLAAQTDAINQLAAAHQHAAAGHADLAKAHTSAIQEMAQAVQKLADAHMAESEITGPSGKTYRARKVARSHAK
jgi:hypothetical protein